MVSFRMMSPLRQINPCKERVRLEDVQNRRRKCIVPLRCPPVWWPTLSSSATEDCVSATPMLPIATSSQPVKRPTQRRDRVGQCQSVMRRLGGGNATALLLRQRAGPARGATATQWNGLKVNHSLRNRSPTRARHHNRPWFAYRALNKDPPDKRQMPKSMHMHAMPPRQRIALYRSEKALC